MPQSFQSSPQICATQLMNVDACLSSTNYLEYNFGDQLTALANGNCAQACNDLGISAANWRYNIINGIVLCADNNPTTMFNMFTAIGWMSEQTQTAAKTVFRKSQCRTNYWFKIKEAVQSVSPGAPVWATVATNSYSNNGTQSLPLKDTFVLLPGNDFETAKVIDVDHTIPFNHRLLLEPFNKDYSISLNAQQALIPTLAKTVGANSCPTPGTQMPTQGKITKTGMVKFRKDWCYEEELTRGYQNILNWTIGVDPVTGMGIDCWEFMVKQQARLAMTQTLDVYLMNGRIPTNVGVQVAGFPGFNGYLPSVRYSGGQTYTYKATTGIGLPELKRILLYANANKRCKETFIYCSLETQMGLEAAIYSFIKGHTGQCTFEAFDAMRADLAAKGMGQDAIEAEVMQMINYMGIKSFALFGQTFHIIRLQQWSDPTMYGQDGYPYKTMALAIPACKLKDSLGNMVSPVEVFYPYGCGETGGYQEFATRFNKNITGCETVEGAIIREVGLMTNCIEDHVMILSSAC